MIDTKTYTYIMLRYRHDPLAGEVVNVGVVLHCASAGFLGVRVRRTIGRLTKMYRDLKRPQFISGLNSVDRGIKRLSQLDGLGITADDGNAERYAKLVLPHDDSSLIWSTMGSGVTRDPTLTLEKLYHRFVELHDERAKSGRDDAAVWQPVRERLTERNIADRLQPKTIISPIDQVEFEHAWKNGAWHCYQPLSFDLASGDSIRTKAAQWSGHMTGLSKANESVKPYFIVGSPSNGALDDDYHRAIDLLRASALDPAVFEETQIDALIELIQDEIDAHDAQSGQ